MPQGATVVYLDAEKHEGKNWRPALHASLPDSLYSAAIVFPLVAGASGTVDEAHQKKSHTLLPAHDTRRAESLKACYCRSNNSCGCMRFFQTWLSSTGSWIFSLYVGVRAVCACCSRHCACSAGLLCVWFLDCFFFFLFCAFPFFSILPSFSCFCPIFPLLLGQLLLVLLLCYRAFAVAVV